MKSRYYILPLVAGAVSLTSCDQKASEAKDESTAEKDVVEAVVTTETGDEPKTSAKPVATKNEKAPTVTPPKAAEIKEEVEAKVEEVVAPLVAGSVEDLAAKVGFAKHLPKDISAYAGFYNGAKIVEKMKGGKLGQFVEAMMKEEGESLEDLANDPGFQQFAEITGEELFVAFGKGSPVYAEYLVEASNLSNYYQMRFLVKMLADEMLGDGSQLDGMAGEMDEMAYALDFAKDERTIKAFKDSDMPPIYLGFKVSDENQRKTYVEQIQSFGDVMMGEVDVDIFKTIESETGDGFKGVQLDGELVAKLITGDAEKEMKKALGADTLASYKKVIAEKDIVMLAGSVGDYVVVFIGSDVAELKFAANAGDSMLAVEDMAFAKNYASKDMASLIFVDKAFQQAFLNAGGMGSLAKGVQDGLKSTDLLGDTRVLEALLGDLVKHAEGMMGSYKAERFGAVAYLEEGFKFEAFGGTNSPAFDMDSSRSLADLGDKEDILFFANWVTNPEFTEKQLEYVDAIGATAYQFAKHTVDLDLEDEEFIDFVGKFKMVDGMFQSDLLELWGALRTDLNAGLASESAFVIDINGELPTIPTIPKAFIDKGKVPRLSYVSTVKDRSKLSNSWDKINTSAESILEKVSKLSGQEIPMQRPFKNSNDGLASYTFPIPMTHQNCTPTVVVSDSLFFVSSSPDFATQLADRYDADAKAKAGATMTFDFDALRSWGKGWLKLVDENGADFMDEGDMEEYKENKPKLEALLKAFEELDHLKVNTRKEAGEVRTSLHFKVR